MFVVIHMERFTPRTSLQVVTQNEQAPSAGFFNGMTQTIVGSVRNRHCFPRH